jgi:hypothetical protein
MGGLTRKTAKMLTARAGAVREELTIEAQRLLDLYNDPGVSPEAKAKAKKELETMVSDLEKRVETARRLKGETPESQQEGA